jgi:hypothetical protein
MATDHAAPRLSTLLACIALLASASACDRSYAARTASTGGAAERVHPAEADVAAGAESEEADDEGPQDVRNRWTIKTALPVGADPAHGTLVPIEELVAMPDVPGVARKDPRFQYARIAGWKGPLGLGEGSMVTTRGWLQLVANPADADYHLQLTAAPGDRTSALIVEIPSPDSLHTAMADMRPLFAAARAWVREHALGGKEPKHKGTVLAAPLYVTVTGPLFYDDQHVGQPPRGKRGEPAGTLWEIHPVSRIDFARPDASRG